VRWVVAYLLLCAVCIVGLYSWEAAVITAIALVVGWIRGWHIYIMRAWEIGFFRVRREQKVAARRLETLDDEAEEELKNGLRDIFPVD